MQIYRSCKSVLLRLGEVSKLISSYIVCLTNALLASECSKDMWLVGNGANTDFGDYVEKDLFIICAHVHFSNWNL